MAQPIAVDRAVGRTQNEAVVRPGRDERGIIVVDPQEVGGGVDQRQIVCLHEGEIVRLLAVARADVGRVLPQKQGIQEQPVLLAVYAARGGAVGRAVRVSGPHGRDGNHDAEARPSRPAGGPQRLHDPPVGK